MRTHIPLAHFLRSCAACAHAVSRRTSAWRSAKSAQPVPLSMVLLSRGRGVRDATLIGGIVVAVALSGLAILPSNVEDSPVVMRTHKDQAEGDALRPLSPLIFNTPLERYKRIPEFDWARADNAYDKLLATNVDGVKPPWRPESNLLYVDLESPEKQAALLRHRDIIMKQLNEDLANPASGPLLDRTETCRAIFNAFRTIGLNGILLSTSWNVAHFLGAIVGHASLWSGVGPGDVISLFGNTKDRPLIMSMAGAHGHFWVSIAVQPTLSRDQFWGIVMEEFCPFEGMGQEFYYACLHGAGHGVVLQRASHDNNSGIFGYGAHGCQQLGTLAAIDWPTLDDSLPLCEHRLPELTHGCLGGLYHTALPHFARPTNMPTPVTWLSPCDLRLSFPAACFMRMFGHADKIPHLVPAMVNQPGRVSDACLSVPWERGVLGCIYGLSQVFFSVFEVSLILREGASMATDKQVGAACAGSISESTYCDIVQREMHPPPSEFSKQSPLAAWCERFVVAKPFGLPWTSAVLTVQAGRAKRWKACVAGAMHRLGENALLFDIPAEKMLDMCDKLERFAIGIDVPTRKEGRRVCARMTAGRVTVKNATWETFWLFNADELM
jgi:hypothetical protein